MNIAMYMITPKKFFTIQINNEDILAHTSNTFCVSFFSYLFLYFYKDINGIPLIYLDFDRKGVRL